MITAYGSIGLDTIRTPFRTVERTLGGSATYFAYASSFFDDTELVGAVGGNFPQGYWDKLGRKGISMAGVKKFPQEKSFCYDCSFDYDLGVRKANATELGVLEKYVPEVAPEIAGRGGILYLATSTPENQMRVLGLVKNDLSFMDTIEFFINNSKNEVLDAFSKVDGVVLNDAEARMVAGTPNLLKAGKYVQSLGPKTVVVKKGEHGCLLFYGGAAYPLPAFPLEDVVDPSGAGDAFAGGMMGYLSGRGVTRNNLDPKTLRTAAAYGTVMGSFIVEGFGLEKLERIDKKDIEERFGQYKGLLEV